MLRQLIYHCQAPISHPQQQLAPEEGRLNKRKEQNRAAQRAFRERKEKHVKDVSTASMHLYKATI